jgi:hypothetical protein
MPRLSSIAVFIAALSLAGCQHTVKPGFSGTTYNSHKYNGWSLETVIDVLGQPHATGPDGVYYWGDAFTIDRAVPTGSSIVQTSSGLAQVNHSEMQTHYYECQVTVSTAQGRVTSFIGKTLRGNGIFKVGGCAQVFQAMNARHRAMGAESQ